MRNMLFTYSQTIATYKFLTNTKEKILPLEWRNLADTTVTKWLNLVSPIMG